MKKFLKHIKKEISLHLFDYLLVFTAGVFFIIALNVFSGEQLLQFIILLAFTSFYIIWGIYHHAFTNSLNFKVALEYILLGFIVLFFVKLLFFV